MIRIYLTKFKALHDNKYYEKLSFEYPGLFYVKTEEHNYDKFNSLEQFKNYNDYTKSHSYSYLIKFEE